MNAEIAVGGNRETARATMSESPALSISIPWLTASVRKRSPDSPRRWTNESVQGPTRTRGVEESPNLPQAIKLRREGEEVPQHDHKVLWRPLFLERGRDNVPVSVQE